MRALTKDGSAGAEGEEEEEEVEKGMGDKGDTGEAKPAAASVAVAGTNADEDDEEEEEEEEEDAEDVIGESGAPNASGIAVKMNECDPCNGSTTSGKVNTRWSPVMGLAVLPGRARVISLISSDAGADDADEDEENEKEEEEEEEEMGRSNVHVDDDKANESIRIGCDSSRCSQGISTQAYSDFAQAFKTRATLGRLSATLMYVVRVDVEDLTGADWTAI